MANTKIGASAALSVGPSLTQASTDYSITEAEAAKFLGLKTPKTLYFWRLKGSGPRFMRYGTRCIRYRVKDLIAWQERQLVSPREREDT